MWRKPIVLMLVLCPSALLAGQPNSQPLHERIDQIIESASEQSPAPLADDAEFLRRVWLDFTGTVPPADEARGFLDDNAANKREKLIDRLLSGPEYARRMRDAFDVMLMERRGSNKYWSDYLERSFAANKPWDQMAREILHGDHTEEDQRGAAFFYTKRLENYGQNPVDYPRLTRDIGRLFLGMDLQCAQCHDHLFVDDYKQVHFQGLAAFVQESFIRKDTKFPALGEKLLTSKVEFSSVFYEEKYQTGPRLPGGAEVEIPMFEKGQEYLVAPNKNKKVVGVPKFSPRKVLAEQLASDDVAAFRKNSVNRLWFLLQGRGIVNPLDLAHGDNPPSHPELLDLLADEFAANNYNIKWLLREIALSRAYQRSSRLPEDGDRPAESFLVHCGKPLSAEQLTNSVLQVTGDLQDTRLSGEDSDPRKKDRDQQAGHMPLDPAKVLAEFRKSFAAPAMEAETEFRPSVKAALFMSNSDLLQDLLQPRTGRVVERLNQISDAAKFAEELYLTVLSRRPTADEAADVASYLESRSDRRPQAVANLVWSLMASTEFCLNH